MILTNTDIPPLEDASQQEIEVVGVIQTIPHATSAYDPFKVFWAEIWRILAPEGTVTVRAPYYTSAQSVLFPRQIGEMTFLQLNAAWREANNFDCGLLCDFQIVKFDYAISPEFQGRAQDAIQYHAAHSWNVVTEIIVVLTK